MSTKARWRKENGRQTIQAHDEKMGWVWEGKRRQSNTPQTGNNNSNNFSCQDVTRLSSEMNTIKGSKNGFAYFLPFRDRDLTFLWKDTWLNGGVIQTKQQRNREEQTNVLSVFWSVCWLGGRGQDTLHRWLCLVMDSLKRKLTDWLLISSSSHLWNVYSFSVS